MSVSYDYIFRNGLNFYLKSSQTEHHCFELKIKLIYDDIIMYLMYYFNLNF